jgi:undecaprenyl-diphosphatase
MMCCRTYLRAHWLTDTFESVLVASGIALILWYLFTPALRRERHLPLISRPARARSAESADARLSAGPGDPGHRR